MRLRVPIAAAVRTGPASQPDLLPKIDRVSSFRFVRRPTTGAFHRAMVGIGSRKGSGGRGLRTETEETMVNFITRSELASRGDNELHALRRAFADALARTAAGSAERRQCLASIQIIDAEIAARAPRP